VARGSKLKPCGFKTGIAEERQSRTRVLGLQADECCDEVRDRASHCQSISGARPASPAVQKTMDERGLPDEYLRCGRVGGNRILSI
jgi:hypothetical protein